jgi:hypothetical protein
VTVHDGKPLGAHSVGHVQLKNSVIDCEKLVPSLRSAVCSLSSIPKSDKGQKGDPGVAGAPGKDGKNGADGAAGTPAPNTFGPYNGTSQDSGDCGNNWANDTWQATYNVVAQPDSSFIVNVTVLGTFVTVEGASPGNCHVSLAGGVNGTLYGDYSIKVPVGADYNPVPTSAGGGVGLGASTDAFMQQHFGQPKGSFAWQFHYDTGSSHWDNTDHGNTGNIT